jgi:hypothetical protein
MALRMFLGVLLLSLATGVLGAADLTVIPTDGWVCSGPGTLSAAAGIVTLERGEGAAPFHATQRLTAGGAGLFICSGALRAASPGAAAEVQLVARNEEGVWLGHWSSENTAGLDGDWRQFSFRAAVEVERAVFDLVLIGQSGRAEFRDLTLEKTDWREGRAANAPPFEFWVNMDYYDNVYYAHNLKLETYDEPAIINYFTRCRELGVTGVQWRVSVLGQMAYPTRVGTMYPGKMPADRLDKDALRLVVILQTIDPLAIAVREAKKNGIKLYIWMTLSDESYKDQIANYCVSEFQIAHPETMLLNRKGECLPGTMCYNEPAALEYRLGIVKELLAYGADGLYLCTRSHSTTFGVDSGDEYGFNPAIVAEYKRRHGVDILTQDFDVEKWRAIKAEALDRLFEETGKLAAAAGQKVRLGVCFWGLSRNLFSANWGNTPIDWQKYLRNGWIDSVVSGQNLVVPFYASVETNRFRAVAKPGQNLYFWAQMIDYQAVPVFPLDRLLRQAQFFAFLGANGGIYHESVNLEEHEAPQTYFVPLTDFYRSVGWGNRETPDASPR